MSDNDRPPIHSAATGVGKRAHEVRCSRCHALQFMADRAWVECSVAESAICVKCWRRKCRRIIPLRPARGAPRIEEQADD